MYQATVFRIKSGFWGPKHKEVFRAVSPYEEVLLAEISKYDDEFHTVVFQDFVGSHGSFDDRPEPVPAEEQVFELHEDAEEDNEWARALLAQEDDTGLPF